MIFIAQENQLTVSKLKDHVDELKNQLQQLNEEKLVRQSVPTTLINLQFHNLIFKCNSMK